MKYLEIEKIQDDKDLHYYGNIEVMGNVEVTGNFTVSGNIMCHGYIKVSGFIKVSRHIKAKLSIEAGEFIEVGKSIEAGDKITAIDYIEAKEFIKSGSDVICGDWIFTKNFIKAGGMIKAGKHISILNKEIVANSVEAQIIHFATNFNASRKYWANKEILLPYRDIILDNANCLSKIKSKIIEKNAVDKILNYENWHQLEKLSLMLFFKKNENN